MREPLAPPEVTPPAPAGNAGWAVIGQLAAGIAHEIKTPTQYVGDNVRFLQEAFADLVRLFGEYQKALESADSRAVVAVRAAETTLDSEYLLAEIPRALEQSVDGLARIATIVLAIKELSHPSGEQSKEVDLNHLIRSSVTICAGEWKHVADLQLQLAPELPVVQCSPGPISQVLINLLVNAVHAIQARPVHPPTLGRIQLSSAQLDRQTVEIRVQDNGTGMSAAVQARIFERYFTTKPEGQGTGQGLALARDTIERRHSGKLTCESELGRGTTFIIQLPIGQRPG